MNKYFKAAFSILTSPYILKKDEKVAFGLPFYIHRFLNHGKYMEWAQYRGKYKDERCFIIGTGPSLNIDDLIKLKDEKTFGVNSIINAYKSTEWRPTYYCITDPKVYKRLENDLRNYSSITSFYPSNRIKSDFLSGPTYALNCLDMYRVRCIDVLKFTKFGTDLTKQIYDGATVVYAAMQIAVYMGFKKIYLMGVDINYGYSKDFHNKQLEYDGKDYKYRDNKDTGRIMTEAFKVAKEFADQNNIEILNVNKEGRLDLFKRVTLNEVLK